MDNSQLQTELVLSEVEGNYEPRTMTNHANRLYSPNCQLRTMESALSEVEGNNELLTRIENPTLAHFRHFSSLFTNPNRLNDPKSTASRHTCHSRAGGNPLRHTQYDIRNTNYYVRNYKKNMQNKPNFQKAQMNVNMVLTVDYEKKTLGERGKNKPNSNPIQTQSNPIKANKMPKQTQYKPKQTQPVVSLSNLFQRQKKCDQKPSQPNILALCRLRLILSNIMFTRILSFYTKYFALWVILFGIVAYFLPAPFVALKPYNEWFFALTMFGIGAVLEINDFKRIAQKPTIVLIGCCAQFSIMPLGAFFLSKLFGLPPEIAIGLILTGSAPGAMASNVMSYIAKADTAYSVSLTTVSTLLCPLLTPGLTFLLAGSVLKVDFLAMVISVLQMVIIPLLVGFGVRHYFRKKIENFLPIFPAISVTFIIFICSLVIALNRNYLIMITGPILAAGLILNIYGMLAGYGVASAFRMANIRKRTLAIEIGMQNAGLGTVLALKHFGRKAAMPAAIFVFICIITASIMAEVWQKRQVTK